ncbi:MAG: Fe-S cluster assembly protein SufD [Candidatus Eiseniibacteriota bacterium]
MTASTLTPTLRDLAASLGNGRGEAAPAWVGSLRRRGLARFDELGLPTLRDEDWRFTDLQPITSGSFALGRGDASAVDAQRIERFAFPDLAGPRLVFVDGRFAPALSRIGRLPKGVEVGSLAAAVRERQAIVEPHLDRLTGTRSEALTALSSAFLEDGLFVHVPEDAVLDGAVHALYVTTPGCPSLVHPRNLVIVGRRARAAVVEDYVSLDDTATFTNAVTEVVVDDGAACEHYVIERENDDAVSVTTLHSEQGRETRFHSHSALLGGAFVRNNVYPVLRGEGGWCLLNGFYVPRGRQHHDTFMVVRHAAPRCDSRQFYRGLLDDHSRGVFSGRIVVHEGAQKTDAKQTNRNILLSDDALIDTKPQLEIYADDVKCTHGATVGQLDADAVFYLRARGIPEQTARGLLIFAFVNEVADRMEVEPVRRELRRILKARLPGARPTEGAE